MGAWRTPRLHRGQGCTKRSISCTRVLLLGCSIFLTFSSFNICFSISASSSNAGLLWGVKCQQFIDTAYLQKVGTNLFILTTTNKTVKKSILQETPKIKNIPTWTTIVGIWILTKPVFKKSHSWYQITPSSWNLPLALKFRQMQEHLDDCFSMIDAKNFATKIRSKTRTTWMHVLLQLNLQSISLIVTANQGLHFKW